MGVTKTLDGDIRITKPLVAKSAIENIKLSLIEAIITALTDAGFTSPRTWVTSNRVLTTSTAPIVGVMWSSNLGRALEVGNPANEMKNRFYIDMRGKTEPQMHVLLEVIQEAVTSIDIIDFDVALASDINYDASSQLIANGTGLDVSGKVISDIDFIGRVTVLVVPDRIL